MCFQRIKEIRMVRIWEVREKILGEDGAWERKAAEMEEREGTTEPSHSEEKLLNIDITLSEV